MMGVNLKTFQKHFVLIYIYIIRRVATILRVPIAPLFWQL